MQRPSWDEYFLELCEAVANRATCDRGKNGCVIVKDKRILTTGYTGSPPGLPHCDDAGHLMKKVFDEDGNVTQHCLRTIHAEQNAIIQAAKFGLSLQGATMFCKMEPCAVCAKMIIGVGIKRVVCKKKYHAGQETRDLFKQSGVELVILSDEVEKYDNQ